MNKLDEILFDAEQGIYTKDGLYHMVKRIGDAETDIKRIHSLITVMREKNPSPELLAILDITSKYLEKPD